MNYEKKLKLQNMYFPEGGNGNLLDLILLLYQAGRRMKKIYIYRETKTKTSENECFL